MAQDTVPVVSEPGSSYNVICTITGGELVQWMQPVGGADLDNPVPINPASEATLGNIETSNDNIETSVDNIDNNTKVSSDFETGQLSVTDTEAQIVASSPLSSRRVIQITNTGNNDVWVGKTGLSTSDGHIIPVGETREFMLSAALYVIAAADDSNSISFMEMN